jgi:two-component system response regulator AtoC
VGDAPRFRAAVGQLTAIAQTTASVVIVGEPGTGKELIARAIHDLGPRASGPFVCVACGALPETSLEDELAAAHTGTLFLDDVDRLAPGAQVALVRALQAGQHRRAGDDERGRDVRVVAATTAVLSELVCAGRFRSDVFYQLCVLTIELPPLRERAEDIVLLARHFLSHFLTHFVPTHERGATPIALSADAERALLEYPWPGNVRELENVIRRVTALAPRGNVTAADLELPAAALPPFNEAKRAAVEAFERGYLEHLLRVHRGNVSRAAKSARKERRDFGRLLKKHRLDRRRF